MRYVKAYLAVVIWMVVIFTVSTDIGSSRRTSRIIGPILRFFNPAVSNETIRAVQAVVRKSAHVTEYAILAALIWRAQWVLRGRRVEWRWVEFGAIVAFCMIYAATDEFHQSFVPSRDAHAMDVLIDTSGAATALLLIGWWMRQQGEERSEAGRNSIEGEAAG